MTIVWRILLFLSSLAVGFAIGGHVAARFLVTKSDGLAGGVMVLWYGVLGAIILLVLSFIFGRKLQGKALPITALSLTLLATVYYGLALINANDDFTRRAGTDADYAVAGEFTASMARLDLSDPYLFVEMQIDSETRKWKKTGPAPDQEVFTATLKATLLVEIREAINQVAAIPAEQLAACANDKGGATKRLRWQLLDQQHASDGQPLMRTGDVVNNQACLAKFPQIGRALLLIERASFSPLGDLKRE